MTTPTQNQLHRPILEILSDFGKPMRRSELASKTAAHLGLTEADLAERTPSGNQTRFENRMGWATSWLSRAKALESPTRGSYSILQTGRDLLNDGDAEISLQTLKQMAGTATPSTQEHDDPSTPDEIMESTYKELQDSLAEELLQSVRSISRPTSSN